MGASSLQKEACLRIYSIKGRPLDNPLICHFSSISEIERYAILPNSGRSILEAFAPGPITLVLKKKSDEIFSTGLPTIAVRIPAHGQAREMIAATGTPISAPSANLSGKPSITRVEDAIATFQGLVDCILIGEPPSIGLESTVLDLSYDIPRLLRPGSIEKNELERILAQHIEEPSDPEFLSPGTRYRHYSPEGKIFILEDLPRSLPDDGVRRARIGFISSNELPLDKIISPNDHIFDVYINSNQEYANLLYSFLVDCDKNQVQEIFCQIPKKGKLYSAILNRLEKAIH
jgi:L-threonylcarbamoyladenylate synthase